MTHLPHAKLRSYLAVALIIGAALALTLHRLGAADVCSSNEAVEGVFLQQMVEHGELLFPLENQRSPMYKPPLFHWTATAIDRVARMSRVTAFNLRLPAALYAAAGVALTIGFALNFFGSGAAALAGLILIASYQYIEEGRVGRVDMTLCFFETLALFLFLWWFTPEVRAGLGSAESPSARNDTTRYLFAFALGLGVLAKGPVGALLPALACGIFLLAEKRLADLREIAAPGPVLLAFGVGSSWYLACYFSHHYGFLDRQLLSENFGRFFGVLGTMPPWYYLEPILLNSVPLSLLVPFAVYSALGSYWRTAPASSDGSAEREIKAVRLLAIFWMVTVIFFSAAAYKRRAYLLPLWPGAAVMLAWWLRLAAARSWGRVLHNTVAAACAALVVFNFIFLPRRELAQCGKDSFRRPAAMINRIVGRDEPLYLWGLGDQPAPLLFYLDRSAPRLSGALGDSPPSYVIVPLELWNEYKNEALDLEPVLQSSSGKPPIVLLRHGKALAAH